MKEIILLLILIVVLIVFDEDREAKEKVESEKLKAVQGDLDVFLQIAEKENELRELKNEKQVIIERSR